MTVVLAVGYQLTTVARSEIKREVDLSSLKYFIAGGTKIWSDDVALLNDYLPNGRVTQFYSLTEFGTVALNIKSPNTDAVGLLRNGVKCKIVNENGEKVGVSVDGEICIKAPTKLLTCSDDLKLCDGEGFLRTGDIGHFDHHGNLYVVDRSKDIFKCYEEYIYPSEIESIIKTNPGVEDVCIVGVPDKLASDLTTAVVVKKPGAQVSEDDIKNLVKSEYTYFFRMLFLTYSFFSFHVFRNSSKKQAISWRRIFHQCYATNAYWKNSSKRSTKNCC